MSSVIRIDTGATHGWQARFGIRHGKKYASRLFSDRKCGGRGIARARALQWLDERGHSYADTIAQTRGSR